MNKAKSYNFLILVFSFFIKSALSQNIYTYAGSGTVGLTGDGNPATASQISPPVGLYMDTAGNLFFSEGDNRVRKVNVSGILNSVAGNGLLGTGGDGGPALSAQMNAPFNITLDALGNLFIPDEANHRIRKVDNSGIITKYAGQNPSFSGDGGPVSLALFNNPSGLTFDAIGNLYIADMSNNRIRMVNASSVINTIAGTGPNGFFGDGGLATAAQFNNPVDVKVDALGNIYIADYYNARIRKINTSGIITTIAGNGGGGFGGDGGPATSAQIGRPGGIAVDGVGNIYVTDNWNSVVRKINTSGIISTIAGTGVYGFSGDGGPAISAQLKYPQGITLDSNNNIYIADFGNQRIRIICATNCPVGIEEYKNSAGLKIFPNPISNALYISTVSKEFENSEIEITNYLGQTILKLSFTNQIDVSKFSQGFYNLKITSHNKQVYYSKFVKE